nr:transposase family protein [Streptomyces chartreusis]
MTHARKLGLVKLLANGSAMEILADAGYQGLGAQTGGRVSTPPHRKFKNTRRSGTRRRVGHGIGHLKNWRALAPRHHGRREHTSDIIQAVAGLISHQPERHHEQHCANVNRAANPRPRRAIANHARGR